MSRPSPVHAVPAIEEDREFIVAEISKNWTADEWQQPLICQKFEEVIEVNRQRGYVLHSFQLHRLMTPGKTMNETIIAVFQKKGGQ